MPRFFVARCLVANSALLGVGLLAIFPVYAADPPRRTGEPRAAVVGVETCTPSVRRFIAGPGRRPGATVVPVTLRLQVLNTDGDFVEASADRTRANVTGRDITLKAIVGNLSLYDVGNVVIEHSFLPGASGIRLDSISNVSGDVTFNERLEAFVLETVPSDDEVAFTFHILLSADLPPGPSESQIRLEDFEVLEAERRFPERTPETPIGRSSQTVERVGIGGTDVACYTGDGALRVTPTSRTSSTSTVSTIREPGPPYVRESVTVELPLNLTSTSSVSSSASLSVEKRANTAEVQPGGTITYMIVVTNRGSTTLRDILVDDRWSSAQLRVNTPEGGTIVPSGIQWRIATLEPGAEWVMRYRAQVLPNLRPGESIPTTTIVSGEGLLDIPTTQRSASVTFSVIEGMPRTGVELRGIMMGFQILGGSLFAFLLFTLSISSMDVVSRKWLTQEEKTE